MFYNSLFMGFFLTQTTTLNSFQAPMSAVSARRPDLSEARDYLFWQPDDYPPP
jgi:hypothetical protein